MSDAAESIGRRLRRARGELTQPAFAAHLGVTKDTIGKYERGERRPEAEVLARMREVLGIDINWLLTGEGQPHTAGMPAAPPPASTSSPAPLDADLVGRVLEAISVVYKEAGWGKTLAQLGAEAAQIAADIAADGLSDEARRAAVQAAAAMLRRQLRQAVSQPGGEVAGKRGA